MRRSAAFLTLACCLAGCADKPSTDVAAPTPKDERKLINACLLLTPEEADEAAGEAVDMLASPLDVTIGVDSVKCSYGDLGPPLRLVSVEVRRLPNPERARAAFSGSEATMRRLAVGKVESVPGLGEAAFWAGGNVQQLHTLSGDLLVRVAVELGEESKRQGAAEAIARRALERIAENERPPNKDGGTAPNTAWGAAAGAA
jgi:hypothetical protein